MHEEEGCNEKKKSARRRQCGGAASRRSLISFVRFAHWRDRTVELTRQTLLLRAKVGDAGSWERLVARYGPLIRYWLSRQSIPAQDADDLTQDVLAALAQKLPEFRHEGRPGSF